jgi:hypothetical protein
MRSTSSWYRLSGGAARPLLAVSGSALLALPSAYAQFTAAGTVNSSAVLVRTLSVSSTSPLDFGTFAPGATPGTVVMSAAGSRSATGGVTLVTTSEGSSSTVSLTGTPSTSYSVSLPSSVLLTANTGNATMTLGTFTTTLTGLQGTLSSAGLGSFGIGGTLAVSGSQAIATYTGTFTVTLSYN